MFGFGYFAQFYVSDPNTTTTDDSLLHTVGNLYNFLGSNANASTAGFIRIGTNILGQTAPQELIVNPLWEPSSLVTMQLRAWEGPFLSYDAAVAGGACYGKSALWNIPPGYPPGVAPTLVGRLQGFYICPEPTVLALGLLGVGALLLVRRRR